MADLINFIRFNDEGTLKGNIAVLDFDFDITGEALNSANQNGEEYLQLTLASAIENRRSRGGQLLPMLRVSLIG